MSQGAYRLSQAADADLRSILRETLRIFGTRQHAVYTELIVRAAGLVAEVPERIGSADRGEFAPGLRCFPIWLAARRRSASPHILYYQCDAKGVRIVRILHEAMDPALHLGDDTQG